MALLQGAVAWWHRWLTGDRRAVAPSRAATVRRAMTAWTSRRPRLVDAVLAAAVAGGTLPQLVHHARMPLGRFAVCLLFTVLLVVPLIWRRRFPLTAFALVAAVALSQWLAGVELAADAALLVYLYTVASRYPMRVAVLAAGALEVGTLMAAVRWPLTGLWTETFVLMSGPVAAALMLGANVRHRREAMRALTERAEQLERERDQQAVIAAAEERTRIAREMHDVVAHSLAVMVTLSEGAARKQAAEPRRAGEAMRQVSATGRQALDEMRRLLGVLRIGHVPDSRRPQPGVAEIDDLLDQIRTIGLTATATVTGTPAAMPPGAGLAVYRIVQEALTNALKHAAGASRVDVRIDHRPGLVTVEVHDDGTGRSVRPAALPVGQGLIGMRERTAVYGGTVTAGPHPTGGWQIRADLPLTAESTARSRNAGRPAAGHAAGAVGGQHR